MSWNHRAAKTLLKALIILSPLPFAGALPESFLLIKLLLLIFSFLVLVGPVPRVNFPYWKHLRTAGLALLAFMLLQIVPLPVFLVKLLSPKAPAVLQALGTDPTPFTSLSLIPSQSFIYILSFSSFALLFAGLLLLPLEKKEIISFLNLFLAVAAGEVLFGMLKLAQGSRYFFLFFHPQKYNRAFLTGTFGNPDHLAFFLEMALAVAMGLLLARLLFFTPGASFLQKFLEALEENKSVLLYISVILLTGAGIIMTGSRAGLFVMLMVFLLFMESTLYYRTPYNLRKTVKIIILLITLIVLFFGVNQTIKKFATRSLTQEPRLTIWSNTLALMKDFPLTGTGLGTYRYIYRIYEEETISGWTTHAHNEYLEFLAESGIVGFLLLAAVLSIAIAGTARLWFLRRHPEVKAITLGILFALFAALLHSVFDFGLRMPANSLIFTLLLALGIRTVTYRKEFTHGR